MGADGPAVAFGLLGPLEVVVDGATLPLRAAKVRTVLAVLLLQANRVVSSDHLLDVLWGDDLPASAANTLHTYVSQLRKLLPRDLLRTQPPGYVLAVGADQLDVTGFERLAAQGRALLDSQPAHAAATLRAALALWRGPALADFADEPFAHGHTARLDEARLGALEDRVRADLALGEHSALIGELEALVAAHPLREHLAAHLMLALYRSGRQTESLRAYQRLRRSLGEELGLEPSPSLVRLEAAVLAHAPELELEPVAAPPPAPAAAPERREPPSDMDWAPLARLPFVGRQHECELLAQAWAATGGDLRVVVVEGDPGVGKTRLLAEAGRAAQEAGHCLLYGRGDEHLGDAYRLFSRVLQRLSPADETWPPTEPAPVDDADARRLRFFTAVSRALATASGRRLVLVLDDLQWADVPSLLLLRHVLLDAPRFPLTVLAVLGLGPRVSALTGTVGDLERLSVLQHLELAGLRTEDVGRLAELSPARVDRALVPQLWSETGGNALFVTEVLREMASTRAGGARPLMPTTVPDVVGRRLRTLSASAQSLLVGAAVLGTPGDGPLLGRIAELDWDATVAALDEAAAGRLLLPVPSDTGTFEFSHRMVCAAIYERVPAARRLDLHRRVALALEAEGHGSKRPAELARHWTSAGHFGDPAVAIGYLLRAGEAADQGTGYESAVDHYRTALGLMDRHPDRVEPAARCEVLLALAATEDRSGDVNAGKAACRAAFELAGALGRGDLLAQAALEYGGLLPTGADPDDPESARLLSQALAVLDPASIDTALVSARLAELQYWVLARHERRSLCDRALATVRRLDDRRALARVLIHRFWALNCPDEMDERLSLVGELEELAGAGDDRELLLRTGKCRLHLLLELGDFEAACRLSERMARTAAELNHREYQRLALAFDAMVAGVRGRYEEAGRLVDEARRLMDRRGHPGHATVVAFLQDVPARWLQGRLGEVVTQAQFLVEVDPGRPYWRALLAWAAAEAGDAELARSALAALDLAAFVDRGPSLDWWSVLAACANTALLLDDHATGLVVYDALLPYDGRNMVGGQIAFYGAVSHVLGVLAAAAGDEQAAVSHLGAALDRHDRMRATPFVALTSAELARLPTVAQDRRRREQLTLVAATIADRLGLAHVSQRLSQEPGRRATA